MSDRIETRPCMPGDAHACLDLYNEVYPFLMTPAQWQQRQDQRPWGRPLTETAWIDGILAGFYEIIPVNLWSMGELIRGAFSGLAITRPRMRRKGVFSRLGKSLYARAAGMGIRVVYGFPTHHNRYALEKNLGWSMSCGSMLVYRNSGICKEKMHTGQITRIEEIGQGIDLIWDRLGNGTFSKLHMAQRNAVMVRQCGHCVKPHGETFAFAAPNGAGGFVTINRWMRGGELSGLITDIIADSIKSFRKLTGFAVQFCREEARVSMLLPEGNPFAVAALGAGFIQGGAMPFGFRWLESGRKEPGNWYYTMADVLLTRAGRVNPDF